MAAETNNSIPDTAAVQSGATNEDGSNNNNSNNNDASSSPATEADRQRPPGKAGRTDYHQWHKVTKTLLDETEQQEQEELNETKAALGLDGKYARSQAEAEERKKAKDVKKAKKVLESYKKREYAMLEGLKGLLGPVEAKDGDGNDENKQEEQKLEPAPARGEPRFVRVTRDMIDAGKRVVKIEDTSGASQEDTIVLTSDLSLLESKMKANAMQPMNPKEYPDDAQNDVKEDNDDDDEAKKKEEEERSVFGVIKCFISNVHNCTLLIKCKIISGTVELSHCSNLIVRVEKDATVATVQADLCQDVTIEFRDAPSGKNTNIPGQPKVYWGEDKEDRIFHAGVKNMRIKVIRDGYIEQDIVCDYEKDGAKAVGKATELEYQFVTSIIDEQLVTEAVVREGATTGENARAMTKRELEESKKKREKAASMALNMAEDMIKFKETNKGAPKVTKIEGEATDPEKEKQEEESIEEVYGSMSKEEIDSIVSECEKNKLRGNEAFKMGEYAQAILLYSLALDKAEELPDVAVEANPDVKKQLFPRDITLSNRAACFLKMGTHEKALEDAKRAVCINPENVKALFREGLALHALKQYQEATHVLAKAHKLEPKNKQIKEALQFAEVRFTQEMRKRMEG